MKKALVGAAFFLLLVIIVLLCILNSNYYYSKKLVTAIRNEDISKVQQIISRKPSCVNEYPSITPKWWHSAMNWRIVYPLTEACTTDNKEIVMLLLECGADPNCNDGVTPLSVTYSGKCSNWYAISLLLIDHGASLDYATEYSGGRSSVLQDIVQVCSGHSSSECEFDEEVIQAFNYAMQNCNHDNIDWVKVFQHSVSNNRLAIVQFLLEQGYCKVNDTTSEGISALMFASRDSSTEMVQLLLDYGADVSYKSPEGKTALDYATKSQNIEVMELLTARMTTI